MMRKDSQNKLSRTAFSVLELLVGICILAILNALCICAVQKARASAIQAQSRSKLRQIAIALHSYAADSGGILPGPLDDLQRDPIRRDRFHFLELVRFFDGEPPMTWESSLSAKNPYEFRTRKIFQSPADPTLQFMRMIEAEFPGSMHPASYNINMYAMRGLPSLQTRFEDGTSNTIAYCERFALVGVGHQDQMLVYRQFDYTTFDHLTYQPDAIDRRASFADRAYADVVPVTDHTNHTTTASVPGVTFQIRPDQQTANSKLPQTPYESGLLVAYFDGSVRMLSPRIREMVFWGMVTRDANDHIND